MSNGQSTRDQVEEFLYQEAELIDDWRLPEWSELYTEDARYDVTSLDCVDPVNSSAKNSLFLLADDKERLTSRAKRLMKKTAHAEFPHSKVRHIIQRSLGTKRQRGNQGKSEFRRLSNQGRQHEPIHGADPLCTYAPGGWRVPDQAQALHTGPQQPRRSGPTHDHFVV